MKRLDMDDMLSSIRRLVSDRQPEETPAEEASAGLFLLTPSHRVDAAEDASSEEQDELRATLERGPQEMAEPSEEDSPPAAEKDLAATFNAPESLEARIADLERAVTGSNEQWEPDGSEPISEHEPDLHVLEKYRDRFASVRLSDIGPVGGEGALPQEEAGQDEASQREVASESLASSAPVHSEAAEVPTNSAEPLQLEDVALFVHRPVSPEPEADASEEVADDAATMQVETAGTQPQPVEEIAEPTPVDAPPDAPAANQKLKEIAQAVVRDAIDEELAEQAEALEEAEPVAEMVAPQEPAMPPAEVIGAEEELLVDEELLRQIVSDIVKEELQGRLGERITRNVRRMVRQEIERTISMKQLR